MDYYVFTVINVRDELLILNKAHLVKNVPIL